MAQKTFADKAYVNTELAKKENIGHTHKYAGSSSAGGAATSANKVNQNLAIKLNSGTTEGTNLFTFNGSAAKTINITPSSIGAAASTHGTHVSYGGNGSASTVSRSDHTHSYLPLSGGTMTGNVSYQFTGTGGHAIGSIWKNNDTNKTTFGGIGALANAGTGTSLYIGWGSEPWVASNNLQVSSSGIKYKNNKIYHAGDKPTPADIGAAVASHGNHVPTTQAAQNNVFLRNDNTWQKITPENIGAAAASHGTHVTYGGNGSAATVSRSDHTHSYLPLSGGTMTGDIKFTDVTSTTYPAKSTMLTWNGSTDGADIYYQVDASDKGRLVLNTRDDADCIIAFANKGTIVSTIDNSGNFSGKAATATKATQDSAGQQINTTYIKGLSVSGKVITYTKGDGTTGTITTQDTNTNTTYTAGTGLALSGTTFNHSNSVTAGTAQGDANKTLSWGGTFTIPTVTYDAQGHVTGKGTTTMTMPGNPNSDTKVTNTLATTTKFYLTGTTSATTNTGTQHFDTGVYVSTTAGELVATKFTGALNGNANTATKATQDSAGQQINTTYIKGLSVSGKTITYTKGDGTTGTITTQDTNTDTKVTNTVNTTTKYYVTGSSSASTNTGTQIFDTNVYVDATAGKFVATTMAVNNKVQMQYNSTSESLDFIFI